MPDGPKDILLSRSTVPDTRISRAFWLGILRKGPGPLEGLERVVGGRLSFVSRLNALWEEWCGMTHSERICGGRRSSMSVLHVPFTWEKTIIR